MFLMHRGDGTSSGGSYISLVKLYTEQYLEKFTIRCTTRSIHHRFQVLLRMSLICTALDPYSLQTQEERNKEKVGVVESITFANRA